MLVKIGLQVLFYAFNVILIRADSLYKIFNVASTNWETPLGPFNKCPIQGFFLGLRYAYYRPKLLQQPLKRDYCKL